MRTRMTAKIRIGKRKVQAEWKVQVFREITCQVSLHPL